MKSVRKLFAPRIFEISSTARLDRQSFGEIAFLQQDPGQIVAGINGLDVVWAERFLSQLEQPPGQTFGVSQLIVIRDGEHQVIQLRLCPAIRGPDRPLEDRKGFACVCD